jgi:hypothetical protein
MFIGCAEKPTSNDIQKAQQETILAEGTAQVGMPAIKNFRERKMLKDILELRDQTGLVTYTYMVNELGGKVVTGVTALAGKLVFVGESIGYGIPYATQFTNPQSIEHRYGPAYPVIAQADPNGLFSPASAEGTWVLLKDPNGTNVRPVYIEPRIVVSPFKFPFDK